MLSAAIREVKKIYDRAKMSKQDGYLPFMGGVWEAKQKKKKKEEKKIFCRQAVLENFQVWS